MSDIWKRLRRQKEDRTSPAPGLRCTHCDLVVEQPDSLFCPRCCRPLTGTGDCGRCFGCGACDRGQRDKL